MFWRRVKIDSFVPDNRLVLQAQAPGHAVLVHCIRVFFHYSRLLSRAAWLIRCVY